MCAEYGPPDPPVREAIRRGDLVDLGGLPDERRIVPAAWVSDLITDSRTFPVPLRLSNAIIEGDLTIRFITFPNEVMLRGCRFTGFLNARATRFEKSVHFERCEFKNSVNFERADIVGGLNLSLSRFEALFSLIDVTVGRNFTAMGAVFETLACDRIRVGGSVSLTSIASSVDAQPTIIAGRVSFVDARIGMTFESEGVTFQGEALFARMKVEGGVFFRALINKWHVLRTSFAERVEFRGASFGAGDFAAVCFRGAADFQRCAFGTTAYFASFVRDGVLYRTEFCGVADFRHSEVRGVLAFDGARFSRVMFDLCRATTGIFRAISLDDLIVAVTFDKEVRFRGAEFSAELIFEATTFWDDAVLEFVSVGLSLHLLTRAGLPTRFHRAAWFSGARVGADLNMADAEFCGPADFSRVSIGGTLAATDVVFRGYVSFANANVAGMTGLDRSSFAEGASFEGSRLHGAVSLRSTYSDDDLHFTHAMVGGVTIEDALIRGLDFAGMSSETDVYLMGTRVLDLLVCVRMAVEGRFIMIGSQIEGPTLFTDASFGTLVMSDESEESESEHTRFFGPIDLRRLAITSFSGQWPEILGASEPFYRDAYLRFEKLYRVRGEDREAGDIYYSMRTRIRKRYLNRVFARHGERRLSFRERTGEGGRWLFDVLQAILFRYGVRPLRLLVAAMAIVLLGTFVFSRPHAVEPKDPRADAIMKRDADRGLSSGQAFGLSMRLFVPIVELPAGQHWTPSSNTLRLRVSKVREVRVVSEMYAMAHRLIGALIVPLGLAVATGVLIRRDRV